MRELSEEEKGLLDLIAQIQKGFLNLYPEPTEELQKEFITKLNDLRGDITIRPALEALKSKPGPKNPVLPPNKGRVEEPEEDDQCQKPKEHYVVALRGLYCEGPTLNRPLGFEFYLTKKEWSDLLSSVSLHVDSTHAKEAWLEDKIRRYKGYIRDKETGIIPVITILSINTFRQ